MSFRVEAVGGGFWVVERVSGFEIVHGLRYPTREGAAATSPL